MIEVYKIVSGKYDPEVSDIIQIQKQTQNTRGHEYKLFKQRCRLNLRKHSFCNRVCNIWNDLPKTSTIR